MKSTVTDLDYFVALGHSEADVREALRVTNGNRNAALYILVKGDNGDRNNTNTAWRKEMPEDWQFGVPKHVPNMAENRALHKSPVYVFVESHRPIDGYDYEFVMKVTLKDGREWKVARTYSQFSSFKFSLPLGTCYSFKNAFPQPVLAGSIFGDFSPPFLGRRQQALAEWMRELVLNEGCMSSSVVLDLLYTFLDADAHGGRVGLTSAPKTPPSPTANTAASTQKGTAWSPPPPPSPLLAAAYDSQHAAALKQKQQYYSQARLLGEEQLPLSLDQVVQMVPVKVNVKKLKCYADLMIAKQPKSKSNTSAATSGTAAGTQETVTSVESSAGDGSAVAQEEPPKPATVENDGNQHAQAEVDLIQLRKDCQRDRIVVQGKRFEGSHTALDSILQTCRQSVLDVIARSGRSTAEAAPKKANTVSATDAAPVDKTSVPSVSTEVHDYTSEVATAIGDVHVNELGPPPAYPAPARPVILERTESAAGFGSQTATAPAVEVEFDALGKCALQMISRTESAYLSHASLHDILDMENRHQLPTFQPYLFVPESTLAEPLQLRFSVLERNNLTVARSRFTKAVADDWCVECHGETSTVYRLLDAMELQPLLQLRVTYIVTLFGMPHFQSGPLSAVTGLRIKEGKCQLVIDKATTTTSRDWAKAK